MKTSVHSVKTNKSGGEVKNMKRLIVLTICLATGLLLLGIGYAFAQNVTNTPVTSTQNTSMHEVYSYTAFGEAMSGTQTIKTVTTTTGQDKNGKTQTKTTTTTTTNKLEFIGGSLKISSSSMVSDSTGSDKSTSHTTGTTTYTYNANGQLQAASGTAHTTGNRGQDANGQDIGTFTSDTTDTYQIKNGQALRTSSTTTGTNYGVGGAKTGDFKEDTTFNYQIVAGSWQLMSEVTHTKSNEVNGSWTDITKTKTYQRDATGITTGLTQTATGTRFDSTAKNAAGVVVGQNLHMSNYTSTTAVDPQVGWYISGDSWDWVQ